MALSLLPASAGFLLGAVLIVACAALNRVRGGGLGGDRLPGATDLWVGPVMGVLAALAGVELWPGVWWPVTASAFAACWLAWSTPAWGYLFGLWFETPAPGREPSWYEAAMLRATAGNRTAAFGLRMTLFLIPMALLFGWGWLALGPVLLAAYIAGWLIGRAHLRGLPAYPAYGIPFAEVIAGSAWGAAILIT